MIQQASVCRRAGLVGLRPTPGLRLGSPAGAFWDEGHTCPRTAAERRNCWEADAEVLHAPVNHVRRDGDAHTRAVSKSVKGAFSISFRMGNGENRLLFVNPPPPLPAAQGTARFIPTSVRRRQGQASCGVGTWRSASCVKSGIDCVTGGR